MTQEKQFSLLLFSVAGSKYFIDINSLLEIIPYQAITRLPGSSERITGITNYRGQIIGVFDLPKILEIPEDKDRKNRIIVVKNNKEKFGLAVSRVFEVAYINKEAIKKSYGMFAFIASYKGEEIEVLNPGKISQEET
ncbi:MAG: hypothetical protein A2231_05535 [Candidatus Firestonebacteria bacterium RIFOXYA2_FULL_40_8]|nr:MAG: hypothetical protein A2231_05535 [Candidatus Firestonebacteria bacterium RIFOXYA2_FULL_40_8]